LTIEELLEHVPDIGHRKILLNEIEKLKITIGVSVFSVSREI
jgi:hypothetical protein